VVRKKKPKGASGERTRTGGLRRNSGQLEKLLGGIRGFKGKNLFYGDPKKKSRR